MARLNRFARSLLSSYASLGANVLYSLTSIPLVLHFLSKEQFGLWAVTTQIMGYMGLVDFGMTGAVARLLVDYKEQKHTGEYGGFIRTGFLVNLTQAGIILLGGLLLMFVVGSLMSIPLTLEKDFQILFAGQIILLAINFLFRIVSGILTAHQRSDIVHFSGVVFFAVNFGVLWVGLKSGFGILSMLYAQMAGVIISNLISTFFCFHLSFFPKAKEWGAVSRKQFWELFSFGRDVFIYLLGNQFVNASQTILCVKLLGLEMGAIWSIGTRVFELISRGIYQIFDISSSAFAEMMVRNEKTRLLDRFRSTVIVSMSVSILSAAFLALFNQSFVSVWTKGKVSWIPEYDVLLGIWLLFLVLVRCHVGLAGQTKNFKILRWIYFFEGLFFVGLSFGFMKGGGIITMISISIICSLMFSVPYGVWRTSRYLQIPIREILLWFNIPLRMGALLILPMGLCWWLIRSMPATERLVLGGISMIPLGISFLFLFGIEKKLRDEVFQRFFKYRIGESILK
jgi:O-antigen/teichoic acid export membrane protein